MPSSYNNTLSFVKPTETSQSKQDISSSSTSETVWDWSVNATGFRLFNHFIATYWTSWTYNELDLTGLADHIDLLLFVVCRLRTRSWTPVGSVWLWSSPGWSGPSSVVSGWTTPRLTSTTDRHMKLLSYSSFHKRVLCRPVVTFLHLFSYVSLWTSVNYKKSLDLDWSNKYIIFIFLQVFKNTFLLKKRKLVWITLTAEDSVNIHQIKNSGI